MNERLPEFFGDELFAEITRLTSGLVYVSETDAEVLPFAGGYVQNVTASSVTGQSATDLHVAEMDFDEFFYRLTTKHVWHGNVERERAEKYLKLKKVLEDNLRKIKVFKFGRIQIEIYVVGLDRKGDLIGIKTKAVET